MKNIEKVSLNIWFFVFILGIIFFVISTYLYQDYSSIRLFLKEFLDKDINILLIWFIFIFWVISWLFSYFVIKNIYKKIEEYNTKLKDYNHYLAHELKTPISVVNSNLEVLEYWFNIDKIIESKIQLKNMTNIINWLLNFSESFNDISKKEINLENFIKNFIWLKDYKNSVKIINNEFNFTIKTDEILFERIIKNLIENALKYSPNRFLNIYIASDKLIFENEVYKEFKKADLEKIMDKFYTKSCNENSWSGIGLSMIKEIVKVLWYEMKIDFKNDKFIVTILFNNN